MNPQIMIFSPANGMLKMDYNIEMSYEQIEKVKAFIAGLVGREEI